MFRIIGDRCTGKTYQLMQYAKDNNAIFVCSNPHSMRSKAESYGIIGLRFMNYSEYLNHSRGMKEKFVIDEVEILLRLINPCMELIGYNLSEE